MNLNILRRTILDFCGFIQLPDSCLPKDLYLSSCKQKFREMRCSYKPLTCFDYLLQKASSYGRVSISPYKQKLNVSFFCSPVPNYIKTTVETVMAVHKNEPSGDILAFLTGQVIS